MRIRLAALYVAAAGMPATAQLVVGGQTGVGANVGVGVDASRTVGGVTSTLDRTVDATDRTVNRTLDRDVRVATGADVRTGATVRDSRGRRVGTVQAVHGDAALVVRNGQQLHVPLASLYRSGSGLVTNLSRAELGAGVSANAAADARTDR